MTKDGKPVGELAAKNIILATGARARALPGLEPDGKLIWTYHEAMVPEALPKSLLVVGSGAIGIEFASFYRDLGAEVTVVEVLDRVLPVEDEEISAFAQKAFEKQGMKIFTSTDGEGAEEGRRQRHRDARGRATRSQQIEVERVILAVGIVGNVENIGLEKHQGEGREHPYRDRPMVRDRRARASMPSATSSARPGSRTRRCTKA